MKKEIVAEIISDKASLYGFEVEAGGMLPRIKSDNINISLVAEMDYDKSDMKAGKAWMKVIAAASISKMGGNPTPDELLTAANEIARGAHLVEEIQNMNLSFIYEK
jgi:hypothetical protein